MKNLNVIYAYAIMMGLIILVGFFQSWNVALSIFNLCLISAVMTIGANMQWGYAGLINFGIMGYTALGGLAAVLISVDPVQEAWRAGGFDILMCLWLIIVMILVIRFILKNYEKSQIRTYSIIGIIVGGIIAIRVTAWGHGGRGAPEPKGEAEHPVRQRLHRLKIREDLHGGPASVPSWTRRTRRWS